MIKIKTILLPMDGSACSWKALEYALAIARRHGARVLAFHVVDRAMVEHIRPLLQVAVPSAERLATMQKEYEANASAFLGEVVGMPETSGVEIATDWVTGLPAEDIVKHATGIRADLIVMGTHGRRGVSHLLLGSVAERVVRTAPCPVLTVRSDARDAVEVPRSPEGGVAATAPDSE